jgi:hypothetical protein
VKRAAREPSLGPLAADWIEAHCVIPDRDDAGMPFLLYNEQLRFLDAHYRLKRTARPGQKAPAFVYRRSLLIKPQKWGKGPLTAAQVCLEGVGPALFLGWAAGGEVYDCRDYGCGCGWMYEYEPGEPMGRPWSTPLIQITAFSEQQAGNIYDALRPMIEKGPLDDVIPKLGEEFTRLPNDGRIDVVTSNAQSRLGQRVTFVPQDETGLWLPSNGMTKVATTQRRGLAGMGGRSVETTNMPDPGEESVALATLRSRRPDIYKDAVEPPPELDFSVKADRWRIYELVYGDSLISAGGHIDPEGIDAEALELMEKNPAEAERFFGNRMVQGRGAWMSMKLWELAKRAVPA